MIRKQNYRQMSSSFSLIQSCMHYGIITVALRYHYGK